MSLSAAQTKDLEDAFFLFAYDENKKISTREVGPVIRSIGLNPTEAELKEIVNEVNQKCGGNVDCATLARLLGPRANSMLTSQDQLRDSFSVFDKNGNGMIAVGDLKNSLTVLGERLPDEIVDEIIREVDQDGEGQVNIEDVIRVLIAK